MSGKSSSYTPSVMVKRVQAAASGGPALFANANASTISVDLDPSSLNKAGRNVRESRDSDVSPNSKAIAVIFDGTGSMYQHPQLFAEKLASLMTVLVKDGFVLNPHLLFGQICDYSDAFTLQLGKFEADNKMDSALTSMALRGGGGGSPGSHEAYELILWYLANHAEMDCLEKRGEKGWLFMIGDEMSNDFLMPDKVKKFFNLDIPGPIPLADILKDLKEKFHVHWILPSGTMHWDDPTVRKHLTDCYGEDVHYLEDPTAICETIAGIIAAVEGFNIDQINAAIGTMGGTTGASAAASSAIVSFMQRSPIVKAGRSTASAELVTTEGAGANRL